MSFLDSPCPAPPSSDQPPGMSIGLKYLIGISVSLTASCLSSLGVNIQAAALAAERERNKITAQQVHDALQHDDLHSELDLLEAIPEGGEEGGGDVGDDDGGVISSMSKTSKITINTTTTTTTTTNPASSSSNATAATGGNNVNLATFSSNQDISNNTTFSAPPSPVRGGGNNNNQHTPSSPSSSFFNWRLFLLRSQWYFGFIIYLVCQTFGSVISLAFIPPSVVAPLGVSENFYSTSFTLVCLKQ